MTLLVIGLFLIWLGGFATGLTVGLHTQLNKVEVPQQRVRPEDLYPKRDHDAP